MNPSPESRDRRALEVVGQALALLGAAEWPDRVFRRNGVPLLLLPVGRGDAGQTLRLYQPQRALARLAGGCLRAAAWLGCHRFFPKLAPVADPDRACLDMDVRGCGLLLGDPTHRIPRAIAAYRRKNRWEVAKIAIGPDGSPALGREAGILAELARRGIRQGVPECLGFSSDARGAVLRMNYIGGKPVKRADTETALAILEGWAEERKPSPFPAFEEAASIHAGLTLCHAGDAMHALFDKLELSPGVAHGDFARWNMLRDRSGKLWLLDWEWGNLDGMPGLDLVHWISQDARLVRKLPAIEAVDFIERELSAPRCLDFLARAGWPRDVRLPMIASYALKVGSGQQDCRDVLVESMLRHEAAKPTV